MKRILIMCIVGLLVWGCEKPRPVQKEASNLSATTAATQDSEKQWVNGWRQTTELLGPRAGTAAVVHNDVIYVIGGVDGRDFVATVEFAPIQKDGDVGQWQFGPELNEARGFIDAVVSNDTIYVVGGGNGPSGHNLLRSVESAKINADGSLAPWVTEQNAMKIPRRCSKVFVSGNYIYSLGGFGGALLDSVERAPILADGHLGEWTVEDQTMTLPRYVNAVKEVNNNAYVFGGHDQMKGVGIVDVEWATPAKEGGIGNWKKTSPLQTGRYGLSSAHYGNFVYALGGLTGLEYLTSIEFAQAQDNGELSAWKYTTDLPEPRATFSALVYNDRIYIIGGTNQDRYLSSVEYATFKPDGQIGFWGTAQEAQAYHEKIRALNAKHVQLPNEGVVLHVQNASMYTYLNVNSNLGDIWLAGPKIDVQVNDHVRFSKGVSMSNFYSKELQQQFPAILFVGNIEKVSQ